MPDRGWWVIAEKDLLAMLRAVQDGEQPDVVLAEAYANADFGDED
jgi:hypothetical protein